jgi:serine/threonine-protein kinase RsbW
MESVVELSVPAAASHVGMIRSATAAICAQADFTLDGLDDVQLAVDEACALILADAPAGSHLVVTWRVTGHEVGIDLTCPSGSGQPVATNTFAWTVLTALVDRVEAQVRDGDLHILLLAHGIESTV